MASLPSDLSDLHPQTTREWFMFLNTKIDTILESQAEDRDTLIDYMQKTNDWIKCHDNGLAQREKLAERHDEKIKELERKVNGWNILNSIGVVIAAILAALGLKGS
jgi:hypothetical protein